MEELSKKRVCLHLHYQDFVALLDLLNAYREVNPQLLPGMTKLQVHRLYPIKDLFMEYYKEAHPIQLEISQIIEKHFKGRESFILGAYRTDYLDINGYGSDISMSIDMTIEQICSLYYYTNLYKDNRVSKHLKMRNNYQLEKRLDIILKSITDSIMSILPNIFVFDLI